MLIFKNRQEAGTLLAQRLREFEGSNALVLALPRGGVVLGKEIAQILNLPMDLIVVKKIGHPLDPEYAVGAITANGVLASNEAAIADIGPEWLKEEISEKIKEAKQKEKLYLQNKGNIKIGGKTIVLVDDGIATGLSTLVAIRDIRAKKPQKIIVAVPVISKEAEKTVKGEADEVISLVESKGFIGAIGSHYEEFPQVSDEEVINILQR